MGVWIETRDYFEGGFCGTVTPFVGVWIETLLQRIDNMRADGHTLRGCVD